MTRLGTWIAPHAIALWVGVSGAIAAADLHSSESQTDPADAIAPANVDGPLPAVVRWKRIQTTAHRRERTAVIADCRDLLNEWRNDPRRAEVMFFLGQLYERNTAGQPSNPVQAMSWYELAATVTTHDHSSWLKYELAAVRRSLWKSKPGDSAFHDLHRRLDIAERIAGNSPMDMARVLETRFALTRRQRDLIQAEIVCRKLHDLQSTSQNSLTDSELRSLDTIGAESAATLLRAWGLSPTDARTREQQIQDLGREFSITPDTINAAIRLSSRRGSASAEVTQKSRSANHLWMWLTNGGFALAWIAHMVYKRLHPRTAPPRLENGAIHLVD